VWRLDYITYLTNPNCDYGPNQCTLNPLTLINPVFAAESSSGWTHSMQLPKFRYDGRDFNSQGKECDGECLQGPNHFYVNRIYVDMPDGSSHEFRKDDAVHQGAEISRGTFYSVDGTRMRYEMGSDCDKLFLPDGSIYEIGPVIDNRPQAKYIDRNGNVLTYRGGDYPAGDEW
jgi:hypothetical protein